MNKIWKLQRPFATNEDIPMIMAYTENKQKMAMLPSTAEWLDDIFGDEAKIYVKATVKNGVLKIKKRVPEQDW